MKQKTLIPLLTLLGSSGFLINSFLGAVTIVVVCIIFYFIKHL